MKILKIIKNFLDKILKKNKNQLLLEDGISNVEEKNSKRDVLGEKYFVIYNNVKNGIINLDDLITTDLIKILVMYQSEISIYDDKIENLVSKSKKCANDTLFYSNKK